MICTRCCKKKSLINEELICESCKEDLDLLHKQLETNQKRIKKLKEHKKSTESELANNKSNKDHERLFETLKRIKHNLNLEYEINDGITKAMKDSNFY